MSNAAQIRETYEHGEGILRILPTFVPRRFGRPGRRLRLHPDDYFALGTERGAIKERWFSSTIAAMNGPLAAADEGMSYVMPASGRIAEKFTLKSAVEDLGAQLIGASMLERHGGWPTYSKFFDYATPLFHHLHLNDQAAGRVGRIGKPESYFFPPQLNNYAGEFPVTYFGFSPDVTKDQVRARLLAFESGDNRITELSRAYRLELGTGWYTPPGVVHAPGSYLTYEPQWNSDVNSVYENVTSGEVFPYDFLVENCPEECKRDVDYVMSLMDWEKNIDPDYRKHWFRPPVTIDQPNRGYVEKWISYANPHLGATEQTVLPGETVTVTDPVAYGCILVQGHGQFGPHPAETATMLRFGQPSGDEFFVAAPAAQAGVVIANHSKWEPLVVLKHYGPDHPNMP